MKLSWDSTGRLNTSRKHLFVNFEIIHESSNAFKPPGPMPGKFSRATHTCGKSHWIKTRILIADKKKGTIRQWSFRRLHNNDTIGDENPGPPPPGTKWDDKEMHCLNIWENRSYTLLTERLTTSKWKCRRVKNRVGKEKKKLSLRSSPTWRKMKDDFCFFLLQNKQLAARAEYSHYEMKSINQSIDRKDNRFETQISMYSTCTYSTCTIHTS